MNKRQTIKILIIGLSALLFSEVAFANGGLPIIFVVNAYAFIAGSILVLVIESVYLKKLLPSVTFKQVFSCVLKFNLWSGLFGIIGIPILIMLVQLEPLFYLVSAGVSEGEMKFIWWSSFSVDFLLAYFATVFIEYKLLMKAPIIEQYQNKKTLLGHVVKFNLLSYLVLTLLVVGTIIGIK